MTALLTLEEAQRRILASAKPLETEDVPTPEAVGRVAAEDTRAVVDLPPFPSSAMDGFAVRVVDLPGRLAIVGEAAAGHPSNRVLRAGEAVAISTGGVVPEGADAVIPIEYVVQYDNVVEIAQSVASGANVRPRGGDVAAGDVVVPAGRRIAAAQLGALAAAGVASLRCGRRPRVEIVVTGSELAPLGASLVAAALASVGAHIEAPRAVADDETAHREALERGLDADVLVTSGGVSVGTHDLVREIERRLGVEEVFWRVAVKPGKPLSFGVRRDTLVFGLPGNPVSALVGCELFVKPALRALQGLAEPLPCFEPGRLAAPLARNDGRDELVRARSRLDPQGVTLEPLIGQESHMIARAAAADAFVHVPRGKGELAAGEIVSWLRLGQP